MRVLLIHRAMTLVTPPTQVMLLIPGLLIRVMTNGATLNYYLSGEFGIFLYDEEGALEIYRQIQALHRPVYGHIQRGIAILIL